MNALLVPFIPFSILYAVWFFYLAIMSLYRARKAGTLTPLATYLGYPIFVVGWALDFLGNMLPTSMLFLSLPRELLITARLQRYADGPDSWRRRLALWFASNLLDPFDPKGYHVKVKDGIDT